MRRSDIDPNLYKEKLLQLQADLLKYEEISNEAAQTVELDQTKIGRLSRMDALQAQALNKETNRMRTVTLDRIKGALQRIEEDNYGICLKCGKDISIGRLEFDPTHFFCVACAR